MLAFYNSAFEKSSRPTVELLGRVSEWWAGRGDRDSLQMRIGAVDCSTNHELQHAYGVKVSTICCNIWKITPNCAATADECITGADGGVERGQH